MNKEDTNLEQLLDLNEIFLRLKQGWFIVVGCIIIFLIIGYGLSNWLLPRGYEAKHYVVLRAPAIEQTFGATEWRSLVVKPIDKTVINIAMTDSLISKILDDETVNESLNKYNSSLTLGDLRGLLSVRLEGNDLLSLIVTSPEPEIARVIVDKWAHYFIGTLNSIYGIVVTNDIIEKNLDYYSAEYLREKQDYEDTTLNSTRVVLDEKISAELQELKCIISRKNQLALISSLLENIQEENSLRGKEELISETEKALVLSIPQILLSNTCPFANDSIGYQLNNSNREAPTVEVYSEEIAQLHNFVTFQIEELNKIQNRIESEIPIMNYQLTVETNVIDEKRQKSEKSLALLLDLEDKAQTVRLLGDDLDNIAFVIGEKPILQNLGARYSKTYIITASFLGLIFGLVNILWKKK